VNRLSSGKRLDLVDEVIKLALFIEPMDESS